MSLKASKIFLSDDAWYMHINNNPLNVKQNDFDEVQKLAPKPETVNFFGKKESPHCAQDYAFSAEDAKRMARGASSKKNVILPPPESNDKNMKKALNVTEKFRKYANEKLKPIHELNGFGIKIYRNGNDRMGEHADGFVNLYPDTPIFTLSLGATRKIILRKSRAVVPMLTPKQRELKRIELSHGDIFVMGGDRFQKDFEHELPPEKKVTEPRASIILRARVLSSDGLEKTTATVGNKGNKVSGAIDGTKKNVRASMKKSDSSAGGTKPVRKL